MKSRRKIQKTRLILVTGLSGAGKSSALKVLEDLGYEVVDNLPIGLIGKLLLTEDINPDHPADRPLAIGVDSRTRAFSESMIVNQIEKLRSRSDLDLDVIYFDCNDDVLARRFSETRRRHPLAIDRPVADGIALERERLIGIRDCADLIIDTTNLSVQDLRAQVSSVLTPDKPLTLTLSLLSFGYARGLPRDADLVFDVRFLRNPHYVDALRPMTGRDKPVADYVAADPDFEDVYRRIRDLILRLLPRYAQEGKAYLTVAVGCTGGKHRSVFVVECLSKDLANSGFPVNMCHRDADLG